MNLKYQINSLKELEQAQHSIKKDLKVIKTELAKKISQNRSQVNQVVLKKVLIPTSLISIGLKSINQLFTSNTRDKISSNNSSLSNFFTIGLKIFEPIIKNRLKKIL